MKAETENLAFAAGDLLAGGSVTKFVDVWNAASVFEKSIEGQLQAVADYAVDNMVNMATESANTRAERDAELWKTLAKTAEEVNQAFAHRGVTARLKLSVLP